MHKKEDDLAAFLLAGLHPQSWRRAASSVPVAALPLEFKLRSGGAE